MHHVCSRPRTLSTLAIVLAAISLADCGGVPDRGDADAARDAAVVQPTDTGAQPADTGVQTPSDAGPDTDAPDSAASREASVDASVDAPSDSPTDAVRDATGPLPSCLPDMLGYVPTQLGTCAGLTLRDVATTRALTVARPWDGATTAGAEIAPRVCALVVAPIDGISGYWASRVQMTAYARTEDGRWYDVSRAAAWSVTTDSRYRTYSVDPTGFVSRGPRDDRMEPVSDGDPSINTVTARFAGQTATRRWNVSGHYFWRPLRVRGPSTLARCARVGLETDIIDSTGSSRLADDFALLSYVRFTVSDPTVVAVGSTGIAVGLRPGTATISAMTPYQQCDDRTCSDREASTSLTITVVEGASSDASTTGDASSDARPDA